MRYSDFHIIIMRRNSTNTDMNNHPRQNYYGGDEMQQEYYNSATNVQFNERNPYHDGDAAVAAAAYHLHQQYVAVEHQQSPRVGKRHNVQEQQQQQQRQQQQQQQWT